MKETGENRVTEHGGTQIRQEVKPHISVCLSVYVSVCVCLCVCLSVCVSLSVSPVCVDKRREKTSRGYPGGLNANTVGKGWKAKSRICMWRRETGQTERLPSPCPKKMPSVTGMSINQSDTSKS